MNRGKTDNFPFIVPIEDKIDLTGHEVLIMPFYERMDLEYVCKQIYQNNENAFPDDKVIQYIFR